MEYYDQAKRVVQIGEGALGSYDAIPLSARNLHAGHLGMIDPIRSSESRSIGVDQRFTMGAMKGNDNHVYFPVRNRRTGEIEYLNSTQLVGKTLGFGKAPSLAPFRTPMPSIQPPSSVGAPISPALQQTPNVTPQSVTEAPPMQPPKPPSAADFIIGPKTASDEQSKHRLLEKGEVIRKTDEVIGGDDDDEWEPVPSHLVGKEVWSDWRYASNLKFRRVRS